MKKWLVAVLLISYQQCGLSAQATISGQGQVLSSPDFVELSIQIDSKCYPTPQDARKINDEASRKIVDFLNSKIKKKSTYNSVIATGGYTLPYQTYYDEKYFCQDTFQKQSNIIFRTQDLKNFESLFDEIQEVVYQQVSRSAPSVIESAISYATMSTPMPGISDELRSQLEQKAIALAFKDAFTKLSALFGTHQVHNLKMTQASELPPPEPVPYFQRQAVPMAMMSGNAMAKAERAPVQFDEQEISKTIYFQFTFDDIILP